MGLRPSELGLSVKGDAYRPGQWETAVRIAGSKARFVLLEGPPGTGKSLIARTAARLLDARRTHIVTGTIQLQEQYERDGVLRAVGRSNFECAIEPVGADAAICTVGGKCQHAGTHGLPGCPYYDQKRAAFEAREAVFNYAFYLRALNYGGGIAPDFLIVDEAHQLKDHVRSFAEVAVLRSQLRRMGLHAPEGMDWLAWRRWAVDVEQTLYERRKKIHKKDIGPGDPEAIRDRRAADALWATVKALVTAEEEDDPDWVIYEDHLGWKFKPVWVHNFVPRMLLRYATEKVLLMSATILNKEVFCQLHGINPDDAEFIQLDSTFRVASRRIYYRPVDRAKRGGDQRALVDAVRADIGEHPQDRFLVHTVSNWLARDLADGLGTSGRRIITHGTADRMSALRQFEQSPGAVLVSPSMHTGVDLPDDLLRAQAIVRLPFPDLGDPLVAAQMKNATRDNPLEKGNRAYTYDTAAALIQTYGRIMRSEDDYGDTYLHDPAWKWFRFAAKDFLPRWFTSAVVGSPAPAAARRSDTDDPSAFLDKFFSASR